MSTNEKFSNGAWPPTDRYVYQTDNTVYPQTFWSYPFLLMFCNHKGKITVPCETKDDKPKCRYEYDVCDNCGKILDYRKLD